MLTTPRRARYDRHLRLAPFGEEGQQRLLNGSVLVVGAGGLGSPALLYLAAAGVGTIGVVDDDAVDTSNLQRQVVHRDADVGSAKVDSAARAIRERNPDVRVVTHDVRLEAANARELVAGHAVVVDGTDTFETRYLLADACHLEGIPLVHGSVHRFEGQVTTFVPGEGPCYRCMFPEPPPAGAVPSCAEAGVLGVLPGVIGAMQATEAIKLLAGIGRSLVGRLLRYDALSMRWNELRLSRDPGCPLCGDAPTIDDVVPPPPAACAVPTLQRLDPGAYAAMRDSGREHLLLDVRGGDEVARGSIPGHRNVPLEELAARLDEIAVWRERLVVCQCERGTRSLRAAELLREAGFERLAILEGGYIAWRREQGRHGAPAEPSGTSRDD